MDGVLDLLVAAVGMSAYIVGIAILIVAFWLLRWAIHHGVDSIAALFGRGPKAKR